MTSRPDTDEASFGTKRRIVGTLVLLVLALIILPQLFDGGGDYLPQVESRIPERPIITLIPEPQQTRPVMTGDDAGATARVIDLAQQAQDAAEVIVAESAPVVTDTTASSDVSAAPAQTQEEERPTLNAAGLPEGWVVQVGTFGEAANASKLSAQLRASGYRAYERRAQREGRELVSVLVGPVLSRSEADEVKARLLEAFKLDGLVKQYELEGLD